MGGGGGEGGRGEREEGGGGDGGDGKVCSGAVGKSGGGEATLRSSGTGARLAGSGWPCLGGTAMRCVDVSV